MSSAGPSLRADEVSLTLGDGAQRVQALDGVSLQVAPGEVLAVLGPSGAGKSSLLAVCGGLRTPTSGKIFVDGREITGLSRSALTDVRRRQMGFVFQQSNLVPSLNALDQLLLVAHMQGRRLDDGVRQRARTLLAEVGMDTRLDRRPDQLSGGERQRVGIARALMGNPAVLLVDEPTSMLDRGRGRQIVELLRRECREHRVGALMVTHDQEMLDLVDRAISLKDGRLSGDPRDAAH